MTLITGNTYPVRAELKAMGGTWDKNRRGWLVPDERAEEANALVAGAPAASPRPARQSRPGRFGSRRGYVSNVTRFSSGAVVYTNKRGRCEDAPCCGCCS